MKKLFTKLVSLKSGTKLTLGTLAVVIVTTSAVSVLAFTDSYSPKTYTSTNNSIEDEKVIANVESGELKEEANTYDNVSSKIDTTKVGNESDIAFKNDTTLANKNIVDNNNDTQEKSNTITKEAITQTTANKNTTDSTANRNDSSEVISSAPSTSNTVSTTNATSANNAITTAKAVNTATTNNTITSVNTNNSTLTKSTNNGTNTASTNNITNTVSKNPTATLVNSTTFNTPTINSKDCTLNKITNTSGNKQSTVVKSTYRITSTSDIESILKEYASTKTAGTNTSTQSTTKPSTTVQNTTKPSAPTQNTAKPSTPAQSAPSTGGTTKPATQPSATVSGNYNANYANEVLAIVNKERKYAGLSALTMNANAVNAAKVRAKEIVSKFDHTRPNGTSPFTTLDSYGVQYRTAGENIAYGQSSPADVMNGWMNSSGHRANILKSSFKEVGIAAYYQNGRYYWIQLFIG